MRIFPGVLVMGLAAGIAGADDGAAQRLKLDLEHLQIELPPARLNEHQPAQAWAIAPAAGVVLDLGISEYAFAIAGGRLHEGTAWQQSRAVRVVSAAGVSALSYYGVRWIGRRSPTFAKVVSGGLLAWRARILINNVHQLRR